jgi:RNA polymerase sigma-70 factor (ECF subfamily)
MHAHWPSIEVNIPRLSRYARALTRDTDDAEDLIQDTLLLAISKIHLWEAGTDLRAWLFTVMHNQYVDFVRRGVREGKRASIEAADNIGYGANQQVALQLQELRDAVAKLPKEQRAVVVLIGLEGMRYEEVADILGVPIGTVRSRLSRARETLRDMMDEPSRRPSDARIGRSPDQADMDGCSEERPGHGSAAYGKRRSHPADWRRSVPLSLGHRPP